VSAVPKPAPAPDRAAHGCLPRVGEDPAPWQYRGWLLPYVVQIYEQHPDVPDRWGYLCATAQAGNLLDDPNFSIFDLANLRMLARL
jgi:hypothetical protein